MAPPVVIGPSAALEEKRLSRRNYTLKVLAPILEEALAFLKLKKPKDSSAVLLAYLKAKRDGAALEDNYEALPKDQETDIPRELIARLLADLLKETPSETDALAAVIANLQQQIEPT